MNRQAECSSNHDQISSLEWITSSLGAILVLGCLTLLAVKGFEQHAAPIEFETKLINVERLNDTYVAKVQIINLGGRTAAKVLVEVVLNPQSILDSAALAQERPLSELERIEFLVDYIPAESMREVTLCFGSEPSQQHLEIRVLSYTHP